MRTRSGGPDPSPTYRHSAYGSTARTSTPHRPSQPYKLTHLQGWNGTQSGNSLPTSSGISLLAISAPSPANSPKLRRNRTDAFPFVRAQDTQPRFRPTRDADGAAFAGTVISGGYRKVGRCLTVLVDPCADLLHDRYVRSEAQKTEGDVVHHRSERCRRRGGMPFSHFLSAPSAYELQGQRLTGPIRPPDGVCLQGTGSSPSFARGGARCWLRRDRSRVPG